jgi:TetR/AcrR family transcriptional repressor of nem operon
MKKQTTKERILDAAEELMLEKGFHSVGLKQILDTVQVPKGSFYHYFASKEQFGSEMLQHYLAAASAQKRELLLSRDREPHPLQRLFAYLDGGVAHIRKTNGKFPCLVLKLASEVTDLSEPMREELAKGFEEWIGIFKAVLDEAVEKKILAEDTDTGAVAQLIQDLWSGATQRAIINRSSAPVFQAAEYIKTKVTALVS